MKKEEPQNYAEGAREFMLDQLSWLFEFLREKFNMKLTEARRLILEYVKPVIK